MTLGYLFTKYGSDKDHWHSYGDFYEELFAGRVVTDLLEIGIARGGSLRAWRDYFPNARVVGIDNAVDPVHDDRIESFRADSTAKEQLDAVLGDRTFDAVIDDGCHWFPEQRATWVNLWPRVRPGGVYVVEDVQNDNWMQEFRDLGFAVYDRKHVKNRGDDVLAVLWKPVPPSES